MKLVILLTFIVLLMVLVLRALLLYSNYRREKFLAEWRPILMGSVMETPSHLPKLNRKYINNFIAEWNGLYEKLGGVSHGNLLYIALKFDIHREAMKMLISKHINIRLTGIVTLGNMQTVQAWPILESIAKSEHIFLSISAYRALILINSTKALDELLPTLIKRPDWPVSMVAKILKDTDNLKVCALITEACENATEKELGSLIQYLNSLKCVNTTHIYRKILSSDMDDHVKSLCLQDLNDPTVIDLVREHTNSQRWHIRMHAAAALGNIGSKADIKILDNLLEDEHWWVRYRAVQALAKMPFVTVEDLLYKKFITDNENVKTIISQVIAEQELL